MNNYQLAISGLSWNTTERKLEILFSEIGKVKEVTLITNSVSGESIGEAFVSMSTNSDAKTAARILDRELVDGKEIRVSATSLNDKSFRKAILSSA